MGISKLKLQPSNCVSFHYFPAPEKGRSKTEYPNPSPPGKIGRTRAGGDHTGDGGPLKGAQEFIQKQHS